MKFNNVVQCPDKPGPPDGEIQFKKVTADNITIMWSPPADEGGAMVTHYIVEKRETSRVMWSIVSEKLEDCIVNVPRLIQGNEYIFRVRGVNKYGVGDPLESEPVIAKNAFGRHCQHSPTFIFSPDLIISFTFNALNFYIIKYLNCSLCFCPVPPSEPSKPKVTMITKSTMTVIWERPALDGGSDIDGYYLEKREKKSVQWFKVCFLPRL